MLAIVGGMQQMIAQYAKDNNIKLPKFWFSFYGGQLSSRGFKEKLMAVFRGIPVVG